MFNVDSRRADVEASHKLGNRLIQLEQPVRAQHIDDKLERQLEQTIRVDQSSFDERHGSFEIRENLLDKVDVLLLRLDQLLVYLLLLLATQRLFQRHALDQYAYGVETATAHQRLHVGGGKRFDELERALEHVQVVETKFGIVLHKIDEIYRLRVVGLAHV